MVKRATIKVFGLVQGVGFRNWAKNKAKDLSLNGFIKNKPDGSVYIEAEGEEDDLVKFIKLCHIGPVWARVDKVFSEFEEQIKNFQGFEIKF